MINFLVCVFDGPLNPVTGLIAYLYIRNLMFPPSRLQWEQERHVTLLHTCLLRPRWSLLWVLWASLSGACHGKIWGSFIVIRRKISACLVAFQCSSVLLPVGGDIEHLGEAWLSAVPVGKHLTGHSRPTGAGSDVTAGHDQKAAGAWWELWTYCSNTFQWETGCLP